MKIVQSVIGIFFAVIVMPFSSCTATHDTQNKSIIGTWSWVRTDGGIANHIHETPLTTGKIVDLKFTSDNTYFYYTNGIVSSQGTYTIEDRKTIYDNLNKKVIVLFPQEVVMVILTIDNQNLVVSDNFYDGVGSSYSRK